MAGGDRALWKIRMIRIPPIIIVLIGAMLSSNVHGAPEPKAWFRGLGSLSVSNPGSAAWGISADGKTVVGQSASDLGPQAFYWTASRGMIGIGDLRGGPFTSLASAANFDGTVIVGFGKSALSGSNYEAFRWSAAEGMVGLGDLPGSDFVSQAYAVSADGKTVVGIGRSPAGFEAFRWTEDLGMVGMGGLPGSILSSSAQAISPDGSVIVGYSFAQAGYEAWRWTAATGMVSLGELPGGANFGVANALSADGMVVVGQSSSTLSGNGGEAFRWENTFPMQPLGDIPGGTFQSVILACNSDGTVMVGQSDSDVGYVAIVWDCVNGMRRLQDVMQLAIAGEDTGELDGWTLTNATSISADGKYICGAGINPKGQTEGWIAKLPWYCYANCDGSSTPPILNAADMQCFLNAFASGLPQANCDNSRLPPVLNVNDFNCFLQKFAVGCW